MVMKLYEAFYSAIDDITTTLISADLKKGSSFTPEIIKTSKDVLFWFLAVKTAEASAKETYVVYNIASITGEDYGDGEALDYNVTIGLNIYTTKEDVKELIRKINIACENNDWKFDLSGVPSYNPQLNMTIYLFTMKKVIL